MIKLLTSQNLWQQMNLLSEPNREDIRVEKIEDLASELVKEDIATVNEMIKLHRLNERESKLLTELLQVNYILEVSNAEVEVHND